MKARCTHPTMRPGFIISNDFRDLQNADPQLFLKPIHAVRDLQNAVTSLFLSPRKTCCWNQDVFCNEVVRRLYLPRI